MQYTFNTKQIARLTGVGYLIIFVAGFFSNFYVLEGLVEGESQQQIARNIFEHISLFKWGILGFIIMILVDIILAAPLYLLLRKTNQTMAIMSSGLRVVNGTIFLASLYSLLKIVQLQKMYPSNAEQVAQQVQLSLEMFQSMWSIALIVFGLHLIVLGGLIIASRSFPSWIGILIAVAGFGYLVDCFAQIGYGSYAQYKDLFQGIVLIPAVLGELSFTIYLLLRGVKN